MFSPGLDFKDTDLPLDPYYLGAWLGDGDRRFTSIAASVAAVGPEIPDWLRRYADFLGMRLTEYRGEHCPSWNIVRDPNHVNNPEFVPEENPEGFVYIPDPPVYSRDNKLFLKLLALQLTRRVISGTGPDTDMKHIPELYWRNSRDVRLKLLAGLMDTDGSYRRQGHSFQFNQSATWHTRLFHDTVFLCKKLGILLHASKKNSSSRRWFSPISR